MGTTFVEPVLAMLGFLVATGVVIALGTSSTARYEFERNGVGRAQQPAGHSASHPAGRRLAGRPDGAATAQAQPQAVGVAVRPAATAAEGPSWWLVGESMQVIAGPFADQVDADWAALADALPAVAVFGARCSDGAVEPRPSPEERGWLKQLGQQLDRLPDDWNVVVSDTDPLTTLVVEIAAALVEAGLSLHDATGSDLSGGVCLLPEPGAGGVLVSWRPHDRMSRQPVRGAAAGAAVQQLMNATLADVLEQQGFVVGPYGATGCSLVTALR
jgi:hypothetical protein